MTRGIRIRCLLLGALLIVPFVAAVSRPTLAEIRFRPIPTQFIAALAAPTATSGTGAEAWGLWTLDPGPRGVRLRNYEALVAAACTVSIGSGFRGGLFSASLFLGALLGGAAGTFAVQFGWLPDSALLGLQVVAMSAFGAAVVGTPLAMAVLAAEVKSQIGLYRRLSPT